MSYYFFHFLNRAFHSYNVDVNFFNHFMNVYKIKTLPNFIPVPWTRKKLFPSFTFSQDYILK